ncbi:MAG: hypothetical protein AAGD22_05420 [Verrucomicrobiota bacterium]
MKQTRAPLSFPPLALAAAGIALCVLPLAAGPFAPSPPDSKTTAVPHDDPRIRFWASGYANFAQGLEGEVFNDPTEALGAAVDGSDLFNDVLQVVSLGQGGQITLTFSQPIVDGPGPDFAVFENAFNDNFLELAFVEVSADGVVFVRFPATSLTANLVPSFDQNGVDTTNISGFAGKYRLAFGTPFDLADLGLSSATHVRIVDIVGDGSTFDSSGNPIYDPYPTGSSAGFDLDAVAVLGTTPAIWRSAHFTEAELLLPSVSGDLADPDRDSVVNIVERALNTDPKRPNSPTQRPTPSASGTALQLAFPRSPNALDLTIHVEASTSLASWTEIARSTNGSPVEAVGTPGAGNVTEITAGTSMHVTVDDAYPLASFNHRFLRLRFTSP